MILGERVIQAMPKELKEGFNKKVSGEIDQYELDKICCYWSDKNANWSYQPPPSEPLIIKKMNKEIMDLMNKKNTSYSDKKNIQQLETDLKEHKALYKVDINANKSINYSNYLWVLRMCTVFAIEKDNDLYKKYDDIRTDYKYKIYLNFPNEGLIELWTKSFNIENEYLIRKMEQ